jgi:hypothetical protein
MSTDVRTLLHDAAETPTRAPDIDAALRVARTRRRQRRGLGAAAAVVVLVLAVGGVALGTGGGSDGPAEVAIGPRQPASPTPDGWQTIDFGPGLQISVPPEWVQFKTPSTAPSPTLPWIMVGTEGFALTNPSACPSTTTQGQRWLGVTEINAAAARAGSPALVDRPTDFLESDASLHDVCGTEELRVWRFVDHGRYFLAQLGTRGVSNASDSAGVRLGEQVLNTLHVEALDETTTTTVPTVSTTGPKELAPYDEEATTTTAPAFVGAGEDEAAIQQVFEQWADDHTDAGLDASTENPDAVRRPSHEGWAQHSPEDLAQYSGRVESITMVDADHARVVYTILHGGQLAFPNRPGIAVRVNGAWKVSTDTVCAMLSLGNIACPS